MPEGTPTPGTTPQAQGTPQAEKIAVKVDGKDQEFTLDELKQMASKASAADRRFEEAATLKKELEEAQELKELMDTDPEFAEALQETYSAKYGKPGGQPTGQQPPDDDEERPLTRKETLTLIAEQADLADARRQLAGDLKDLRGQYGEFNDKELLKYCDQHGIWNVREAYKSWKFDDLVNAKTKTAQDALIADLKAKKLYTEPKAGAQGGPRVPLNIDPNRTLDSFAADIAAKYNAGELDLTKPDE